MRRWLGSALLERTGDDLSYRAVEELSGKRRRPFLGRTAAFSAALIRLWDSPAMLVIAERHAAKHGRDGDNPPLRARFQRFETTARWQSAPICDLKFRVPPQSAIYLRPSSTQCGRSMSREKICHGGSHPLALRSQPEKYLSELGERETKFFALLRLP